MTDRFPGNFFKDLLCYRNGDTVAQLGSVKSILTEIPPDFTGTLHYLYDTVLTEKQRNCMIAYYEEYKKLEEIGESYCVTRERIRQVIAKAIRKLRSNRYYPMIRFGMTEWFRKNAESAIKGAAKDAFEQGILFERSNGADTTKIKPETVDEALISLKAKLSMSIEQMNLSVRAQNCLMRAGIRTVETLLENTVNNLSRVRNLGRKSADEILMNLENLGLIDRNMAYENPDIPIGRTIRHPGDILEYTSNVN